MRRVFLAGVLAACVGLLAAGAVASSAVFSTHNAKATTITVVAGKPSELRFQLSKSTKLKVGTYIFKVTNKGLGFHTFKFCTVPVKTAAKNTCTGKVTKLLNRDSRRVHRRGQEGRQIRVPLQHSGACRRGDEGAHRLRRRGDARAAAARRPPLRQVARPRPPVRPRPTVVRSARRQARRSGVTKTATKATRSARMTETAVSSLSPARGPFDRIAEQRERRGSLSPGAARTTRALAALAVVLVVGAAATGCGSGAASGSWTTANGSVASRRAATATKLDARTIPRLKVRWRFRLHARGAGFGAITSNPVIRGNVVYVQDSTSSVYALDVRTGALLWKESIKAPNDGPNGVSVSGSRLYGATDTTVFALDAASGKRLWSRRLVGPLRAVHRDRADRRPRPGVRQHPGLPAGRPRQALRAVGRDRPGRLALPDDQAAVVASRVERRRRRLESDERRRRRQRVRRDLEPGPVGRVEGIPERRSCSPGVRCTPIRSSCSTERRAVFSGTTR